MMADGGIFVHGWQPRPPFLTCGERSFRSRPRELLHDSDRTPSTISERPVTLLGSFVHRAFHQLAPRPGCTTHGAVGISAKQHVVGRGHHQHYLRHQHSEISEVDSIDSNEMFCRETRNVHATGFYCTPPLSLGIYVQEEKATPINLTSSMATSATGSAAVGPATTTSTCQQNPSSDDSTWTDCARLAATWWTGCIEQATTFASAHRVHAVSGRDGCRAETSLAAVLAESFVETACRNVHGHGFRQRQRHSVTTTQAVVAPLLPTPPTTSDEGGQEEMPVLSQGAPKDPAIGEASSCPSRCSFAREFVTRVMREGFLEAVPVAIAAAQRPAAPLATEEEPPLAEPMTMPHVDDGASRLVEKESEEEEFHHDNNSDRARGARCSDVTRFSSSCTSCDCVVPAVRVPSPTPPTVTTGACVDNTRPLDMQVVRLPSSPLHDCRSLAGSAGGATGMTLEQRPPPSSSSAAINREHRRCSSFSSRKRFRNGTFVRIINVPVKNIAGARHALNLTVANHGSEKEARVKERRSPSSLISQQLPRQEDPAALSLALSLAAAAAERRPRPQTAVLQEVAGVGGGRFSASGLRSSDTAVEREAKSAGAVRSATGVGVEARSRSRGGARVQLRRNRWCSPAIVGDGGSIGLEGSVTSLLASPSTGGGGSPREKLPYRAVDGDPQEAAIVDTHTPNPPPPRGQAHHTSDVHERLGRGTLAMNGGIEDGILSGETHTIYGVAVVGEVGGAVTRAAGEETLDLSSMKSSERAFPPMSYRYKNHVQGSGPQGRTELSAAAAAVTAAAAAAVAAAAAATERSEREVLLRGICSTNFGAEGAQSSGKVDSGRSGGWRVAPSPKPPIGMREPPFAKSRPGRTFSNRA